MPRAGTGKLLDPMMAIGVVKYGLLLGDSWNPGEIPSWLVALLKGKPPTLRNKNGGSTSTGITKKFIDINKIQIDHLEMNTDTRIVQRTRAVLVSSSGTSFTSRSGKRWVAVAWATSSAPLLQPCCWTLRSYHQRRFPPRAPRRLKMTTSLCGVMVKTPSRFKLPWLRLPGHACLIMVPGKPCSRSHCFRPANIGLPVPASMAHCHTTLPW